MWLMGLVGTHAAWPRCNRSLAAAASASDSNTQWYVGMSREDEAIWKAGKAGRQEERSVMEEEKKKAKQWAVSWRRGRVAHIKHPALALHLPTKAHSHRLRAVPSQTHDTCDTNKGEERPGAPPCARGDPTQTAGGWMVAETQTSTKTNKPRLLSRERTPGITVAVVTCSLLSLKLSQDLKVVQEGSTQWGWGGRHGEVSVVKGGGKKDKGRKKEKRTQEASHAFRNTQPDTQSE